MHVHNWPLRCVRRDALAVSWPSFQASTGKTVLKTNAQWLVQHNGWSGLQPSGVRIWLNFTYWYAWYLCPQALPYGRYELHMHAVGNGGILVQCVTALARA